MRILIFAFTLLIVSRVNGQDRTADLDMLLISSKDQVVKRDSGFFRGLLSIYDRHISEQILNDCIYEHSCSTFSQGAFSYFGIIKGYFLTADRLSRCNRASLVQVAPVRINEEGKIRDHWTDYTFHK